jgi:hypothetical protein
VVTEDITLLFKLRVLAVAVVVLVVLQGKPLVLEILHQHRPLKAIMAGQEAVLAAVEVVVLLRLVKA